MFRFILLVSVTVFLSACAREIPPMKKAFMEQCLQGNQGACDVLAADAAAQGYGRAAAAQNWTNATNNTAQWAVDQQNVGTYSGGYRYNYPRY